VGRRARRAAQASGLPRAPYGHAVGRWSRSRSKHGRLPGPRGKPRFPLGGNPSAWARPARPLPAEPQPTHPPRQACQVGLTAATSSAKSPERTCKVPTSGLIHPARTARPETSCPFPGRGAWTFSTRRC
jgi:hypothetical protein